MEKAALSCLIDPSETVVRRADVGASGRAGGAVVMLYAWERADVGFLEAVDVGEEGGVSVLAAETWNSGRRVWELGRHSDSLRRVYHVGKRPNLLRTLARWASAGVSMWVPSCVAM